jgi:ribosome biogenesis GTPase A
MESACKTSLPSIVSIIESLKSITTEEKQQLITFVNASNIKSINEFMFVSNTQLKAFGINIKLLHKCKQELLANSEEKYSLVQLIKIKFSSLSANPSKKQNIRLLTIGKSGSGKSTLVNYLCNYVHEIQYNDPKLFVIPDEHHKCNVKEYAGHSDENGGIKLCLKLRSALLISLKTIIEQ